MDFMSHRNFNVPIMRQPDATAGKLLKRFQKSIEDKYQVQFADYWQFHKWSVNHIAEFWAEMWNFAGVVCSNPFDSVIDPNAKMNGPNEWFKGAELNFAENLLKYRSNDLALILAGEDREIENITFAQMYNEVAIYAAAFRSIGLKKGDVVACYMSNRKEAVFAMEAVTSIGAIWAGALPLLGPQAVLNRFKQVNPKILLTMDRFKFQGEENEMLNKVKEISEGLPSLEKVIVVSTAKISQPRDISNIGNSCFLADFLQLSRDEDGSVPLLHFEQVSFSHPVFINYTSGTTGLPKAVVHGCGGLMSMARDFSLHMDSGKGSIWLSVSSVGWVTWNMVITLLSLGVTLVLYEGSPFYISPTYFWDLVDELRISNLFFATSVMEEFHKRGYVPRKEQNLSALKILVLGGSVSKPYIYDFVYQKIKKDIMFCACYGSTELMGSCLMLETTLPIHQGETNAICLGDKLEILDGNGSMVVGEMGELVIAKPIPNLFVGLWNDPDGSLCHKAYFSSFPGKFSLGDYAIINPLTNGVIVCCRSDETLKQRGCRFGSSEIYNVLNSFPEVQDGLCVSQYNKNMDERAILFLKMKDPSYFNNTLVNEIRAAITRELTVRHVPDVILPIQDIPVNMNGKKMEIIVKKIINKMQYNSETVINPESLKHFCHIPELQNF